MGECPIAELPPGAAAECRRSFTIASPAGTYSITAIGDHDGRIGETNESNNVFRGPPLEVTTTGGRGTIIVDATLDGAALDNFPLSFTMSGPNDTFQWGTFPARFPDKTAGNWTVTAVTGGPANTSVRVVPAPSQALAGGGSVTFTLEYLSVGEPRPELRVQSANGPEHGRIGVPIILSPSNPAMIEVQNVGNAAVGQFRVGFYWSRDRVLSSDDVFAGHCLIAGLIINQVGRCGTEGPTVSLGVPESLEPGNYFLITVADDDARIAELDETNNWRAALFATLIKGLPRAATSLLASADAPGRVALTWVDNSGNEAGFRVERRAGADAFQAIGTVGTNTTRFVDGGLPDGLTFEYRIVAHNDIGDADASNSAISTTLVVTSAPPTPASLTAIASKNQVRLTWQDVGPFEARYFLERQFEGGSFEEVAALQANATSYTDPGLPARTLVAYRLKARNSAGDSHYSNVALPVAVAAPPGLGPGVSRLVELRLSPDAGALPAPGLALTLPLSAPMTLGGRLALFKYVPSTGELLDLGIQGDVDTSGVTARFAGVRSAFTFVAFEIPNQPPVVSAGGPYFVGEGGSVLLTGTASDAGDVLTYAWDLDDDGVFETSGAAVPFSAVGLDGPTTRTVSLRVTDGGGLSTVVSTTVTVLNVAPVITAMAALPASPAEGEIVTLFVAFTDGSATDTHSVTWDFGDGTPPVSGTSEINHRYAASGTFTATGTVTDHQGAVATRAISLTVQNVAPTLGAVTNDGPIDFGAAVTVTVTATDAAPTDVLTYHFDFDGDGVFEVIQAQPAARFTYPRAGVFTVAVEVRDQDGGTARGSTIVTVNDTFMLTVLPPGPGRITGDGIDCGGAGLTCTATYARGASVTLIVEPSADHAVVGWTGCDVRDDALCTILMTRARTVSATLLQARSREVRAYAAKPPTSLVALSGANHAVVGEIAVGGPIGAVAIHPDGTRVYGLVGSGTIVAVDTVTHSIVATATLDGGLAGLTVLPDGSAVYVSRTDANTVLTLDPITLATIESIAVGSHGGTIHAHPGGTKVYLLRPAVGAVDVIAVPDHSVVKTLAIGPLASAMAFASTGDRAVTSNAGLDCRFDGGYTIVDTVADAALTTMELGHGTAGVDISGDDTRAFLGRPCGMERGLVAVDIATGSLIEAVAEPLRLIGAIQLSPDGSKAYVLDRIDEIDNFVRLAVIDIASGIVQASVPLSHFEPRPAQLAVGVIDVAVPYSLTVRKSGIVRGTVTGLPAGTTCGARCTVAVDFGREIVLTAQPTGSSRFVGWAGCDTVTGLTCRIAMLGARTVVANFARVAMATVTVDKAKRMEGLVTSLPEGIDCGPRCSGSYPVGTRITLTATPGAGAVFGGWRGCPLPSGSTCTLTAGTTRRVSARFVAVPPKTLTVRVTGSGTVSSEPVGLSCGPVCRQKYAPGTVVTLTANAAPGAVFVEWRGCPLASGATCAVALAHTTTVFAVFTRH